MEEIVRHLDCFNALLENGWLDRLTSPAIKMYLVYLKHADSKTGESWPNNESIAKMDELAALNVTIGNIYTNQISK
jgi:2-methylaconitate cis-trans-isomerase PrpF